MAGVALLVALEPLGVGLERVFPVEVGAHAGDDVEAALFGGGAAIAEEIAIAEVFAFAVEGDAGLVEGEDAGDADEDGIDFEAGPVVGPLFDVEHGGVVLGHVGLADAADFALPGECGIGVGGEQGGCGGGSGQGDELPAVEVHRISLHSLAE